MVILESKFLDFCERFWQKFPSVLLALSGGSDSMALYHLLKQKKQDFHVAHINHGWRQESDEEEAYLSQLCGRDGIAFHCKRLKAPQEPRNMEDRARRARLEFFKQVVEKQNIAGVVLGHHADDQAETVLKRVFEGASLPALKGLMFQTVVEGITLWRPLLEVRKADIVEWLAHKGIVWFEDATNYSSQFLRGRMRSEIFPYLGKTFGKEVVTSLCRLGTYAEEMEVFLEQTLLSYRGGYKEGFLHFERIPQSDFEWKLVVRDFLNQKKISLTHNTLNAIIHHLKKGSTHKKVRVGKMTLLIHNQTLTVPA